MAGEKPCAEHYPFGGASSSISGSGRDPLLPGLHTLKTPYRDGTTHVFFNPLDFLARLAALVPTPKANLIRFHGVAPNSSMRGEVVQSKRGRRMTPTATPAEKHRSMAGFFAPAKPAYMPSMAITWAQRLKRVFRIEIEHCACGGQLKIIGRSCASCARGIGASLHGTSIEQPAVIRKILYHTSTQLSTGLDNPARGPPVRGPG